MCLGKTVATGREKTKASHYYRSQFVMQVIEYNILVCLLLSVFLTPHRILFFFQGLTPDIVHYLAFFSYFALQLAQLFLSCFADQAPPGKAVLQVRVCTRHNETESPNEPTCHLVRFTEYKTTPHQQRTRASSVMGLVPCH